MHMSHNVNTSIELEKNIKRLIRVSVQTPFSFSQLTKSELLGVIAEKVLLRGR